MKFSYETNRLILQLLEPDDASMVLNFQLNNISFFEKYEATRPANFYTLEFQRKTLEAEYQLALRASMIRYYVFRKEDLRRIIGTVCFRDIRLSSFFSCETGYKFDHSYWHQGYAQESMEKAIDVMFFEQNMHRIEASVMPENKPSIRLLEALGFVQEGIARQSALVCGKWEDHIRYALIHP